MLRFAEYNENETFQYFLNVQGIFERGELTARAGAKRSKSHRKEGLCYTTFMAKNGMRIQIETRCEKTKYTYIISMNGKCSNPFEDRNEALKYIQVIGGYLVVQEEYPRTCLEIVFEIDINYSRSDVLPPMNRGASFGFKQF